VSGRSGARTIPFVKASACGNDFLLVDGGMIERLVIDGLPIAESPIAESPINGSPVPVDFASLTRRICDRHDGVGADGVEWMFPHPSADVEIRLINADGSKAEISGNGTRCVAAYICEEQSKEKITLQTGAGLKVCTLTKRVGSEYEFETAMGEADVGEELVLKVGASAIRGVPVSMGNPHYVVFVPRLVEHWQDEVAQIQRSPEFKHGINVELVVVEGKHDITARFFERGVGETRSSGTGSCASAVAAMATGRAESPVRVHAPGGTQTVRMEEKRVFLRGPTRLVCRGDFILS
jgi:diaminopimelate epimerase